VQKPTTQYNATTPRLRLRLLTFRRKKSKMNGHAVISPLPIMPNDFDKLLGLFINYIIYSIVLAIILAVAWFVLRSIRSHLLKTELRPMNYLESFQKMHEEGKLSGEEFRIIRRLVSLQISQSLREQKPNYTLLNKNTPRQLADHPSGNIPKK
jgi:uncharacterized membrane protein